MKALNLVLHCGGQQVSRADLGRVALPAATKSHVPVGHDFFVGMVQDILENAGLRVVGEAHGLSSEGQNYFGCLQVAGAHSSTADYSTVVGLRNSHIKWFAAGMVCGSGVFVCDNLAFHGDIVTGRKHTAHMLTDAEEGLRPRMERAMGEVIAKSQIQGRLFEAYKAKELTDRDAEHLMIEMLRKDVISATKMPKLVQQWDTPDHEEFKVGKTAWRLFNAATETLKGVGMAALPGRTKVLHEIVDSAIPELLAA